MSELAALLADDARVSLGRVRVAWEWLGDAREPGRPGPPASRPRDLRAAAALAEQYRADRAAAGEATRAGRVISGHHPVPVRLGPVETRAAIAAALTDLAARMWDTLYAGGLVMLVNNPADRAADLTLWCRWCAGTGEAQPPFGWSWEWPRPRLIPPAAGIGPWYREPPIPCPRCAGAGRVPVPRSCLVCASVAPCRCDRADVVVALALSTLGGLLDLADVELASDAEVTLLAIAERAEAAVGAGPDRRRLPDAECPVCGSREMHAEVSSTDRREWAIRCTGPDCRCHGAGCPCGIGTPRRRDRLHLWPAKTWDGPRGLARRLGVDLPGTQPKGATA